MTTTIGSSGGTGLGLRCSPAPFSKRISVHETSVIDRPRTWSARLPPPVEPGARVGVAALSGPVLPERLEAGLDALADLGFEPVPASNLRSRHGLFAGSDDERLEAFHQLAAEPGVAAIVFARGGHGVLRLLPRIDWRRLARHPRAYVGYSDLTPFLLQVVRRLGWVSFHGPMVAADLARGLTDDERRSLLAALAGEYPIRCPLSGAMSARVAGGGAGRGAVDDSSGAVEGPLLGGCLSMMTAVLGTPWAIDLTGALVFVEDIDEPRYRIDRMLTHLRLSGNLASLKAMLAGHLTLVTDRGLRADAASRDVPGVERRWVPSSISRAVEGRLEQCLQELAAAHAWPWGWGLPAGHQAPNWTLPLGLWCRFEPGSASLLLGSDAERRLSVGSPVHHQRAERGE